MFAEIFCREWNSIRVRFWSIGYKKRLFLLILVLLVLGCFVVSTTFFADLSGLNITQETQVGINDSTQWDQWVSENGLKAVGDIWDSCDHNDSRKKIGKVVIHYDAEQKQVIGTAVANFTASQKIHVYESFKLPKYIPKGHYFATAKLINEDNVCLGMTESNLII